MSQLLELSEVIRRVVAARVTDRHAVEDLVQETLVRVAAVEQRLDANELQAYAIVTARHLVVNAARRQNVHQRHAHRLVDYTTLDGPEQLVLDKDESSALAVALEALDPADRDLLLRHEVDDVSTRLLGIEHGLSPGGIAMRLARARARLRVEFVLAYRHVTLPTNHCQSVLLAMSAGDHRRQLALRAGEHLLQCHTCAELAGPVTERRRGIAAWLFIPATEAIRLAWIRLRTNRAAQLATIAAATLAIAVTIIAIQPGNQDDTIAAPPTTTASTTTASTTSASPTPATTLAAVDETVITAAASSPGPALARCPPNPLDTPDPSRHMGCVIPATAIVATDVATDEGFLATAARQTSVWVQLVGAGESPIDINNTAGVTIAGTIIATVAGEEPVDQRAQDIGWYIRVDYNDITSN